MDLKEIKQIIELMKRSDLTEFEIEEKDFKLRICRDSTERAPGSYSSALTLTPPPFAQISALPAPAPVAPAAPASPAPTEAAPAVAVPEKDVTFIKSPMVGTFYRSPSPESPSFTDVGASVKEDSVVCIIEAMKVMNEIQAEVRGKVLEVLVQNGAAVEYGQPLFKVKTSAA